MASRERSPNYPAQSLPDTITMVQQVYNAEKRATMPPESVARALGYGGLNGRSRVKISTLRKYGLIDEANGRMRVSDLAMRILFERTPEDRQAALNEAALRPEIFRQLMGNDGASDRTLVNDLVQRGFSFDGAIAAVAAYRETMSVVRTSPEGYDEPETEDDPMLDQGSIATSGSTGPGLLRQHSAQRETPRSQQLFVFTPPGGQRVELRIDGGPWTKSAQAILKSHFDLIEKLVTDDAPAPEVIPSVATSNEQPPPDEQSPTDAQD